MPHKKAMGIARGYEVRGNGSAFSLTVPPRVAELVPDGTVFDCELVEDGLLYRPRAEDDPAGLPDWVRRDEAVPDA